jgi:predicted Zn-dependent protease
MISGLTRDGCFLVKDGTIQHAVTNFRFLESPWLILNRLEAIGTTHRTALGHTPGVDGWPLPPIIVPPLMVRDFNFVALGEAV